MNSSEARRNAFRPDQRVRTKADFNRIFGGRQRLSAREFTIYYRVNGLDHDRLGLSVSRKNIGKAVKRNRAKRRIRELFRKSGLKKRPNLDLVVVPNTALLTETWTSAAESWRRAVMKIKTRLQDQ